MAFVAKSNWSDREDDARGRGPVGAALGDDQRHLLALLGSGFTVDEAAAKLFLSRRTAQRRLGQARQSLGARTNAHAAVLMLSGVAQGSSGRGGALTQREAHMLRLVAEGYTSVAIAAQLGVARSTVESTVAAAMAKLNARTRVQAAVFMVRADEGAGPPGQVADLAAFRRGA